MDSQTERRNQADLFSALVHYQHEHLRYPGIARYAVFKPGNLRHV